MKSPIPPIIKKSEQLLFEVEEAASVFPRRHKYGLGADLRRQALAVATAGQQWTYAGGDRGRKLDLLQAMSTALVQLKLHAKMAAMLQCYSAQRYGLLSRIADDLGKQIGGFQRYLKIHPNGQNPAAIARRERPEILSTRTASIEANP